MSAASWRRKAEALGVEIYPGFAAAEVLFEDDAVAGIATGDMGIGKDGHHKPGFARGMELRGKYTLFAEGARGCLSKMLIERFGLAQGSRAAEIRHRPQGAVAGRARQIHATGLVQHTLGWPLDNRTGGGSFLYHFDDNLVSVGFVVHLNYQQSLSLAVRGIPALQDPSAGARHFRGRQAHRLWRARHHRGRLAVGAEAGISRRRADRLRGGLRQRAAHQGQPQRDAVRHARGRACRRGARRRAAPTTSLSSYEAAWRASPIGRDLWRVRNAKPLWSKLGTVARHRARRSRHVDQHARLLAVRHAQARQGRLRDARSRRRNASRIAYAKPDGKLTFDRLSSVYPVEHQSRGGPAGRIFWCAITALQKSSEHDVYAGPSARYCPAGVYEWVEEGGQPRFVINAQNCVHCKTCDIKDPNQNINWVPPEGGGGPNYPNM